VPQVLLLDTGLPSINGTEALPLLKESTLRWKSSY
jgi:CheY-like chemotaxis protein